MRITVRLFASQRERLGRSSLEIEVPAGATAASALRQLAQQHTALGDADGIAFAVNREHAPPDAPLRDGDELALLPPVAGG